MATLSSASTRSISAAHFAAPNTGVMRSRHFATTSARGIGLSLVPRAEVVAKCRDLITPVLGAAKCAALIERVLALESVTNVRDLRDLLQVRG